MSKQSKFGGKVRRNRETSNKENSYGYLKIPKGIKIFKNQTSGKELIDIIPYIVTDKKHLDKDPEFEVAVVGSQWYKKPYRVHKNVGVDNESIVCPTTFGLPCPLCEEKTRLQKAQADWETEIKPFSYTVRNLYAIIPIDNKEHEEKIHIWDISEYLFQERLYDELDTEEVSENFPALEGGQTLNIKWIQKTFGKNKFGEAGSITGEDREDYDESILAEVPNLDEILTVLSYKEIKAKMLGQDEEDLEDNENAFDTSSDEKSNSASSFRKKKTVETKTRTTVKPKTKKKEAEEIEEAEDVEELDSEELVEGKCPSGYVFGEDNDKYKECGECPVWDSCLDAKNID